MVNMLLLEICGCVNGLYIGVFFFGVVVGGGLVGVVWVCVGWIGVFVFVFGFVVMVVFVFMWFVCVLCVIGVILCCC